MVRYSAVTAPRWADENKSSILCSVVFAHLGDAPVEFNASPLDDLPHGREIYEDARRGKYGKVAPFVAPNQSPEDVAREVRAIADRRIAAVYGSRRLSYLGYFARLAGLPDRTLEQQAELATMIHADLWEEAMLAKASQLGAALDLGGAMSDASWPAPPEGLAAILAAC